VQVFTLRRVQIGQGTHLDSYPMSTTPSSAGVKRPGREADYYSPSCAEVKYGNAVSPLLHKVSQCSA
jgi:hypothetical protein